MSKFDRNRIKDGWEKLCTDKQTDTTKIFGHLAVNQLLEMTRWERRWTLCSSGYAGGQAAERYWVHHVRLPSSTSNTAAAINQLSINGTDRIIPALRPFSPAGGETDSQQQPAGQ